MFTAMRASFWCLVLWKFDKSCGVGYVLCVTLQSSSVVPRHSAADAQLIIQSFRPSWRRALIWSNKKEKWKCFSDIPPISKRAFFLYEDPQISPVSPVERIFEYEEEYGALVERYWHVNRQYWERHVPLVERYWHVNRQYWERHMSHCHFVLHKIHRGSTELEFRLLQWQADDVSSAPLHSHWSIKLI